MFLLATEVTGQMKWGQILNVLRPLDTLKEVKKMKLMFDKLSHVNLDLIPSGNKLGL